MQLVTAAAFQKLLSRFLPPLHGKLALAVSGGPDSMAMAFLAAEWAKDHNQPAPIAFIVDHALRAESATEAATVQARLKVMGVDAEILRWEHDPITSALHMTARKARYELLLEACHRYKIDCLLTAHQREDQAETILMRLAKGTGIDGLAGISADNMIDNVRILRPLLDVPKQDLIATCEANNITYVTDPSNEAEKFARGRLRRILPMLADEGLSVERLVDFGQRAAEARDALQHYTIEFLRDAAHQDECGAIFIDKQKLLSLPRAIALRALSHILQTVHQEDYPPQHQSLSLCLETLQQDEAFASRTLHGCFISEAQNKLMVIREFSAITDHLNIRPGETIIWDGRWRISLPLEASLQFCMIRALGNPPHDLLDRLCPDLRHKIPQGRVRATLPALWLEDQPVLIPVFNSQYMGKAELLNKLVI